MPLELWDACERGDLAAVVRLLAAPGTDLNECGPLKGDRPLHRAARFGHAAVVERLLADPRVWVNPGNAHGCSPFFLACQEGHHEVVWQMLCDPRVEVNQRNNDRCSPLWFAVHLGHLDVVRTLLAFATPPGPDLSLRTVAGPRPWHNSSAVNIALLNSRREAYANESEVDYLRSRSNSTTCIDLLTAFASDPVATRARLFYLPRIRGAYVAGAFAVVVLLADGYLAPRPGVGLGRDGLPDDSPDGRRRRWLALASLLPLELQMVLCNRLYGSARNVVLVKHSEPAFRHLSRLRD